MSAAAKWQQDANRQAAGDRLVAERNWGSGAQGRAPEPQFLVVGQVVGAHGVHGELKIEILTDDPHRFASLAQVFVGLEEQQPVPWLVEGYRLHKGRALVKLRGCDDRNAAQTLRGHLLQVPLEEALSLEEGEYFEHQILGLKVWTVSGECLGEVVDIIYTGANEVYVVQGIDSVSGEILIPAIPDVVQEVDLEGSRLVVSLLDGLL
jgi:16S rRNA processing protein RimM